MKKGDDKRAAMMARAIARHEALDQNSCGLVDRDWDRVEEAQIEFAERLRTRGSF